MSKPAAKFIEKRHGPCWEYTHQMMLDEMQAYADKVNEKLIEALEEISEGKGSYDEDKLKHCSNTVRDMIELANKALGRTTKTK